MTDMKRMLLIINRYAGKNKIVGRLTDLLDHFTQQGYLPTVHITRHPGDATQIACQFGSDYPLVVCSGGDGTLSEVVNGAAGFSNAAVTNVPLGTGNDFLKIFGPTCRERFSDLAALAVGPQAEFDLMDCNGVLGIGVVCAGLDARIAAAWRWITAARPVPKELRATIDKAIL